MNPEYLTDLVIRGIISKEQAMAITTRNLSKPGQMTVEPEYPVKPDKVKFPETVETSVYRVQVKTGNEVVDHYLTYDSMTEDARGIYFHLAKRYTSTSVAYKNFWHEQSPGHAGPVSFYHPYVIGYWSVILDVSDREDVVDYAESSRTSYRTPRPRP